MTRSTLSPRRLGRDSAGALLAESAIILSLIVFMTLGGLEVARYALLQQKLERTAAATGDLVAQAETLTDNDLANLFAAAEHVIKPFELGARGVLVVSSVSGSATGAPVVNWQRSGGGSYAGASRIGAEGGVATLPAGFTLADGDTVIVAEMFYDYTPWVLGGVTSPAEIYHSAYFRPRFGALESLQ